MDPYDTLAKTQKEQDMQASKETNNKTKRTT